MAELQHMYAIHTGAPCILANTRDSTDQNQFNSPLLKLPGELRNRIYEFALSGRTWHIGYDSNLPVVRSLPKVIEAIEDADPCSLLRTCRQIHAEAGHLPLTLITLSCDSQRTLRRWFKTGGKRMASEASYILLRIRNINDWVMRTNGAPRWRCRAKLLVSEPSLKELDIVVDLKSWVIKVEGEINIARSQAGMEQVYAEFSVCKAQIASKNPGVKCTIIANNTGNQIFADFLARTGKAAIL